MKLHIENIAKIKKADIDIKGITVIAGENNTGKSTVGKVLYCLFNSFYDISSKIKKNRRDAFINIIMDLGYYNDEQNDYDYFIDIGSSDFEDMYEEICEIFENGKSSDENEDLVLDEVINILNTYCMSEDMKEQINFLDIALKIKNAFSITDDQIRKNHVLKTFDLEFNKDFYPVEDDIPIIPMISLQIQNQGIDLNFSNNNNVISVEEIKRFLPLNTHIIYLDNPSIIDDVNASPRYKYSFFKKRNHDFDMAVKLKYENYKNIVDEEILQNKINLLKSKIVDTIHGTFVTENNQIKFKEEGVSKAHLINNLSMGIKSFAILLRLLDNNYIEPGACIILDEPEVHLHPKWQLKYAELLVLLQVNMESHILINSHSPYFINAIEQYSKKYKISNICKYYLADVNSDHKSIFEDVSQNVGKIYDKLAEPFDELDAILDEDVK